MFAIFLLPQASAPEFATLVIARFFGGGCAGIVDQPVDLRALSHYLQTTVVSQDLCITVPSPFLQITSRSHLFIFHKPS